jgi:hypothetical protein
MPYDERLLDVYNLGIKPACKAAGANCERADEQLPGGIILEQVYKKIEKADLIISDMTGRNPNVFYEAGYAHALRKKVILLTQDVDDIPFNTNHYLHITYGMKGITELKNKLRKAVKGHLEQSDATQTPAEPTPAKQTPAEIIIESRKPKSHATRREASRDFEEIVEDKETTMIHIAGISLSDMLTEQGVMRGVWEKIKTRLQEEHNEKTSNEQRLRVRLLLLDPQSHEGFFRFAVEKPSAINEHGDVDAGEIQAGLHEIKKETMDRIYLGKPQDFLQVRLYEHCPFSFMFLTNKLVFVEQYYYKASNERIGLPTIGYAAGSGEYKRLRASLDIIWEHARPNRIKVGTATPIKAAKIRNIFRVNKREDKEKHQIESIRNTKTGTVDILTITGRFFSDPKRDALEALKYISSPERKKRVKVRIALLNPVCQQAIFRAVADCCTVNEISDTLKEYSWEEYENSNLYDGVKKTISEMSRYISKGHSIELRLYSCSTANSLLRTQDSIFVGSYIYGRSNELQKRTVLISEYPVIEYSNLEPERSDRALARFDNTEQQVLRCTFHVIWSYYSISYEEYKNRIDPRKKEEFNKNLTRIQEELGLLTSGR